MPIEKLLKRDIANSIANIWHCNNAYCVNKIQQNLTVRSFKRNELIYQENETPTHILYLVNGMAKIIKECGMGRSQVVRIIKEQSFMGFRAFFAHERNMTLLSPKSIYAADWPKRFLGLRPTMELRTTERLST